MACIHARSRGTEANWSARERLQDAPTALRLLGFAEHERRGAKPARGVGVLLGELVDEQGNGTELSTFS